MFLTCSYSNAVCLSGTYTIGGTSPDYSSFSSAISSLVTNGVCGPVVFNVRNGTYSEQIQVPALLSKQYITRMTRDVVPLVNDAEINVNGSEMNGTKTSFNLRFPYFKKVKVFLAKPSWQE